MHCKYVCRVIGLLTIYNWSDNHRGLIDASVQKLYYRMVIISRERTMLNVILNQEDQEEKRHRYTRV